jgi:hypothetical protein
MEAKMKYQLVIQFSGKSMDDFDHLIEIEDTLEENLTGDCEVDGHDFGSGEMNIFILTEEPVETFMQTKSLLDHDDLSNMKAAYRDIEAEKFTILWPKGLTKFVVT